MAASPSGSLGHLAEVFSSELQDYQLDPSALEYAVRHIPKHMRSALCHQDPGRRMIAIGYLYQAVIYNRIHRICDSSREVRSFVRQFNDVPYDRCSWGAMGQNGLYYTTEGQIVVRSNGSDLAEFDGLIFGVDGSILFVEMKTSKNNLQKATKEVAYKRHLLLTLLSKEADFLLIIPDDVKGAGELQDVLRDPRNRVATTKPIPSIPAGLAAKAELHEPSHTCSKAIFLTDLQGVSTFDGAQIHAQIRDAILEGLSKAGNARIDFSNTPLINEVILGSLDQTAVNYLFKTRQLTIDDQTLSEQEYWRRFSRALLVLGLPEGRPKLYLRVRREVEDAGPNYLKLGPWSRTLFGFENNILKKRTFFFNLLESTKMSLSGEQTEKMLETYLSDAVAKRRKKYGVRARW